jgi:hypothetical protein
MRRAVATERVTQGIRAAKLPVAATAHYARTCCDTQIRIFVLRSATRVIPPRVTVKATDRSPTLWRAPPPHEWWSFGDPANGHPNHDLGSWTSAWVTAMASSVLVTGLGTWLESLD